jgi:hypothetical protein
VNEDDVVATVIDGLERLGIEYMLVGTRASDTWGGPRGSCDADLVIRAGKDDSPRIFGAFESGFALESDAPTESLEAGRTFNLIPKSGVFKVDLIPFRKTDFAREEFSRRRRVTALGRSVSMASPDDALLFNLAWHRMGNRVSGMRMEDARDIYVLQGTSLDQNYLDRWAAGLGVTAMGTPLCAAAEQPEFFGAHTLREALRYRLKIRSVSARGVGFDIDGSSISHPAARTVRPRTRSPVRIHRSDRVP